MEGHCGLIAAWLVLHYFGKQIPASEIVSSCRYTKRYGLFFVFLAAGLRGLGLEVSFHSEKDDDIGGFEKRGYALARRLGISVSQQCSCRFSCVSAEADVFPLCCTTRLPNQVISLRSSVVGAVFFVSRLPRKEPCRLDECLAAWSAPGILRQCVVVGNSHQGDILWFLQVPLFGIRAVGRGSANRFHFGTSIAQTCKNLPLYTLRIAILESGMEKSGLNQSVEQLAC